MPHLIIIISGLMALAVFQLLYVYKKRIWEQTLAQKEEEFKKQQEAYEKAILTSIIKTQDKERKRFAADLHDALSGEIVGLRFSVYALDLEEEERASFEEMFKALFGKIKQISYNMAPPTLKDFGLNSALRELCVQFDDQAPIDFCYQWIGVELDEAQSVELSIYHIAKELLTNAMKHAQASKVYLNIQNLENQFILEIQDNGIGINPTTVAMKANGEVGDGINNVQNRAFFLGGSVDFIAQKGVGLTARFTWDRT